MTNIAIIKLKEILNSGELGKVNYIYSNHLNLGKIRNEENTLWRFAPHDISAILYLLDEMPNQVIVQGGNYLNKDLADVTTTILSFKSGVKGHIFVSWLHPDKEKKLIIVGDKKMAVFDDTVNQGKLQIHDKGVEWINRQPTPRRDGITFIPIDSYEPLKAEREHFLNCIESDITPNSDSINGQNVLKILNACQKSLKRNGTAVKLNENDFSTCNNCSKQYQKLDDGIKCLKCNCGSGSEIYNDDDACIDCKPQSNNIIEEELKLPQEADYCSI